MDERALAVAVLPEQSYAIIVVEAQIEPRQDRPVRRVSGCSVLEAQQRAMDENPGRVFYNLNIDAGAMWSRRMIDRMIAKERPASPAMQAAE